MESGQKKGTMAWSWQNTNTFHVYTMGTWIWNMVLSQLRPRSPVHGALLKRGRKSHMKTITYSGRCQVHTIASGKGIWARPIGNFAQQFQSWASYKYRISKHQINSPTNGYKDMFNCIGCKCCSNPELKASACWQGLSEAGYQVQGPFSTNHL